MKKSNTVGSLNHVAEWDERLIAFFEAPPRLRVQFHRSAALLLSVMAFVVAS